MAKVLLLSFDTESVDGRVSFFENTGFDVAAAEPSWPSCLQAVRSFEPDVIALDCGKLPTLCRQAGAELRKAPDARDLPLVLFRVADADVEQTRLQVTGGVVAFEYELTDRIRSAVLTRVANQARAEGDAIRAREEAAAAKRAVKEAAANAKNAAKEAAASAKKAAKEAAAKAKKAANEAVAGAKKAAKEAVAGAKASTKGTAPKAPRPAKAAKPTSSKPTSSKAAAKKAKPAPKAAPKTGKSAAGAKAPSKKAAVKRVASKKTVAPKATARKAVAKRPAPKATAGRRR